MADHYAEAEELLAGDSQENGRRYTPTAPAIAAASVHATLALADALNRNDAASLAEQVARLERQLTFALGERDSVTAAYEDLVRRGGDERTRLQQRIERALEVLGDTAGTPGAAAARHEALGILRGDS